MKTNSITFATSYGYTDVNGVNKAKLQKLMLPNGREISYTYDKNNNIESIKEGSKVVKYGYDGLNQLKREDNGFLGTSGKTITYSYDAGGNILSKNEYPLTEGDNLPTAVKTYEYKYDKAADGGTGWNDKLVKIIVTENGTQTTYDMSYDAIGDLTSYNGNSYTWEGRQLRTITGNEKNISFKYNSSGIRTEKTVDGKVTKYHLVGDRVTYEETKDSSGTVINKIYYIYNNDGELVAMKLDGVQYNYIRNAQGDIIGLLDSTGAEVVSYTYDSWGKLEYIGGTKASTVGAVNPYRYRGYRYDSETNLYYLQSRYYNPEWGRFISTDTIVGHAGQLLSHNIFAYCINNPINKIDINGYDSIALAGLGFIYAIHGVGEIAAGVTLFAVGIYGAYKAGVWIGNRIKFATEKKKADKANKAKAPASPGSLQNQVEKGQAPKDVDRVDKPHVPGQKPHVHFKDGTSLNNDGTIHDAHKERLTQVTKQKNG